MTKFFFASLLSIAWVLPAASAQTTGHRIVLPANVVPTHYDVAIVPDAKALTFSGNVSIDIKLKAASNDIVLNAADLQFASVALTGASAAPSVSFNTAEQTATLHFASPVTAGHHRLTIAYTGKINLNAAGLFALDYGYGTDSKRALFTQFENSDVRRFVPCWDEPNKKAVFGLTATVPATDMALSNMPIATTENLAGGLKRVHFAPSPKMSSYLLFFGSGDFERVSRNVNGVDIGIVFKRGDSAKAQFALDAAVHLLPFYEDYFGVKYPLPKLDMVAGPGSSQFFGAMENWGAIFYFEGALLIDSKTSTDGDRRGVYTDIAHEMAHQWFGDLVTMDWWDDLWLNEGFASWMALKATDHFHPEWNVQLDKVATKDAAMGRDARIGSHAIIQRIDDVLQANQAFDAITYSKGAAVIDMLESYVGDEHFRAGVRRYIAAHAYGNTVTDDLWREVDTLSPLKITQIAHDFTNQEGIPLIRVAAAGTGVKLSQSRFALDESGKVVHSWRVPVLAKVNGANDLWRGIVTKESPASIANVGDGLLLNAGQNGYFRTLYEPALFNAVAQNFKRFLAADQLGLLFDTRMLGYSGAAPLSNLLALAQQVDANMDRHVLATVAQRLSAIDTFYRGLASQKTFRAFGRKVLQPLFAQIHWDPMPGESQNDPLLRASLLSALSQFDDADVIAQANALFATYLQDPNSLAADKRRVVLETVALHADARTWEQLHQLALSSTDSIEKNRFYFLLGTARDPELARRALALTLTDETPVTTRPNIIQGLSENHADQAFDFIVTHNDQVMSWIEPSSQTEFAAQMASNSLDPAILPILEAYGQAHIPASARRSIAVATGAIRFAIMVRNERLAEIDHWLATQDRRKP